MVALTKTARPLCRHCMKEPASRSRGLGWRCFYTPGVRDLYEPKRFTELGTAHVHRPPPAAPTTAAPGTPEKMAVLIQRAKDEVLLYHPADAKYDGDPRPLEWILSRRALS